MKMHILINRNEKTWCFADRYNRDETEAVYVDEQGQTSRRAVEKIDIETFIEQKQLEGFEQF
jgi:hypothetical protein